MWSQLQPLQDWAAASHLNEHQRRHQPFGSERKPMELGESCEAVIDDSCKRWCPAFGVSTQNKSNPVVERPLPAVVLLPEMLLRVLVLLRERKMPMQCSLRRGGEFRAHHSTTVHGLRMLQEADLSTTTNSSDVCLVDLNGPGGLAMVGVACWDSFLKALSNATHTVRVSRPEAKGWWSF